MDQKQEAAERIKQANNILVTVSNNPSVDQLAACIGLTLSLNKMGKHATAVFSGQTPSTIEFLQPEKTLEKNTDSLRDFIIALDKSKADKLRYKVEDRVVKIFITPYRTSINEKDLEFSQGDFNVDVVLALGVHNQSELDQAITSHGRILHDATVVTLNTKPGGELGSINWLDPNASSLSELAVQLIDALDKKLVDSQIATAFLTGIVAETERFSNSKTSPQTMSISAELMSEGANQQLVATKLEEPAPAPAPAPAPIAKQEDGKKPANTEEPAKKNDDGTLEIAHDDKPAPSDSQPEPQEERNEEKPAGEPKQDEPAHEPEAQLPQPQEEPKPAPAPNPEEDQHESVAPQIHIDEHGSLSPLEDLLPPKSSTPPSISHHSEGPKMVLEPPTMGGQLTAAATPGFGEAPGGLGLPPLEPASMSAATANTVGPTIMPPNDMADEVPAGGATRSDSFLVGDGNPTSPSAPAPSPVAIVSPDAPATPQPDFGGNQSTGDAPFPGPNKTLSDIEKDVNSPHATSSIITPTQPQDSLPDLSALTSPAPTQQADPVLTPADPAPYTPPAQEPSDATATEQGQANVDDARDAVAQAISGSSAPDLAPVEALNAQPLGAPLGQSQLPTPQVQPWNPTPETQPQLGAVPDPLQQPMPTLPGQGSQGPQTDPNSPPPVPPPMMPPSNPY